MRLSICIATLNRGDFIGETLASIVPQLADGVEVLVVDGGSRDETAEVVGQFSTAHPGLRYVRLETNSGVDADFDRAVELAKGKYCWLFADDDVLAPDAVATVLAELDEGEPDLLVVDSEVRDINLRRIFERSRLKIGERRDYGPAGRDSFMTDAGDALSFIGCVIVRRSWWMQRERVRYYGSLFVHVGVIFQQPPPRHARVLPRPLVRIRMGNAMWSSRSFEIWMFKWPDLIWSFPGYSDAAKAGAAVREPWRNFMQLLGYRASGSFTRGEYRRFLAGRMRGREKLAAFLILATPGPLAHLIVTTLAAISRSRHGSALYNLLIASRNSNAASRLIGRLVGHRVEARKRTI